MTSATSHITPMMAQYLALKAEAGTALLLFRMGDFYESFLDDATVVAETLDIALTTRGTYRGEPAPMCGVPAHSHEAYVARLVRAGHSVAIAEQVEDPRAAKKRGGKALVERAIVRIITPGTLTEEGLLEGKRANYLLAIFPSGDARGLAWADISTGEFHLAAITSATLADEVARIAPAEILWSEDSVPPPELALGVRQISPSSFSAKRAERALCQRFGVPGLDGFGAFGGVELAAANALLTHLAETQRGADIRLEPPRAHMGDRLMAIDAATRRSLELTQAATGGRAGSLLATIDRTVTPGGARLLATEISAPLLSVDAIGARLDLVQWLLEPGVRGALRAALRGVPDLARLLGRVSAGRGSPRDLGLMRDGLCAARDIATLLTDAAQAGAPSALGPIIADMTPPEALVHQLCAALAESPPVSAADGGAIAAGFDPLLDELHLLSRDSRTAIAALEARLRTETDIATLKVRHNNVIGYHVEVALRHADPLMSHPDFSHRQTMAGTMRFDTEELRTLAGRISQAQAQALENEAAHLANLVSAIVAEASAIGRVADALAQADRSAALAEVAAHGGWCRPDVVTGLDFHITAGRHPVVEAARRAAGEPFVPNDCRLEGDTRIWLVSGPNMGGKSTFLRQNALFAILAQAGSFVPALAARIGVVDRIYSRVGASDSLAEGRSTFMVEMVETAAILNGATARSLLLLDEVGRGTATWDGLALAWAILEAIHDHIGARALFATHYHELAALKGRLKALALRTMKVREWKGELILLHEVSEGAAPGSFGIEVARLAGIPPEVLTRAREILRRLEAGDAGRGARDALAGLPLFGAIAEEEAPTDPLRARLALVQADQLSPRAALDLVYELVEMLHAE